MSGEQECKENYLKAVFDHNQGLIKFADDKANILLGILIILLPLAFGVNIFVGTNLPDKGSVVFLVITFLISVGFLVGSFGYSIAVIYARIKSDYGDMIFFRNISKKTLDEYHQFVENLNSKDIFADYRKEIYAIAKINEYKYKNYRTSILLLIIGVIFLVIGYAGSQISISIAQMALLP